MSDSTAGISAWASSILPGTYARMRSGLYRLEGRAVAAAFNLADGVTVEAYGVKLFQDALPALESNANLTTINGRNIEVKGLEVYGYCYQDKVVNSVFLGTAAAGTYANAVSGSATPDVSGYDNTPKWFARDVNGNMHEDWPLSSSTGAAPTIGGGDVALVASQCVWDIGPPQTALSITDNGVSGGGPTANTGYWYACSRYLSDLRETGLGPMTYYRSGSTKHGVTVAGFPTLPAGNTLSSGVMAHKVYRTKTPGVLTSWKLVESVPISMTSYTDQFDDSDLTPNPSPVGTTILVPGTIPTTPTNYTLTHQIRDDEARILTWCQRISPAQTPTNNVVTAGTVHSVGRIGWTGSGGIAQGQNCVRLASTCRDVTLTDMVAEGANYVCYNIPTAQFPSSVVLNNCRGRAGMEQAISLCSGYQMVVRGGRYGETGLSVFSNEPESTGAALSDLTIIGTVIANWGVDSYGLNSNTHCIDTRFEGVIFRSFFPNDAMNMSDQSLTGRCQVIDTGYIKTPTTDTIAQFQGGNIDLEILSDGKGILKVEEINNPGGLASGTNRGSNALGGISITAFGPPQVASLKVGNTNAPVFGAGDFGYMYANQIQDSDPPFAHTITGASWAANVATLTLALATTKVTNATGIDASVTSMTVENTQIVQDRFPDVNWRTSGIWHYACIDAGTANEEWVAVTAKSGTKHSVWALTRNALPSAAGGNVAHAHALNAPVQMSTSQQIGDAVVVDSVTNTGYNGRFTVVSITPTGLTYALPTNPGGSSSGGTTLGARAWNGGSWIVDSVSSPLPGATIVAHGYLGFATKKLPSPASGASLQNVAFVPVQSGVKIKLRTRNVPDPAASLELTCPSSRVDIELDDGRNQTFVADSAGVARQTGYIGVVTSSPTAGPFPYAEGAWANDPTHSKTWYCTGAGTPGTWKSVPWT